MPRGSIKWFNNRKGFGFIEAEDGGDDVFVHYSAINMEGYKTLERGQPVSYDQEDNPNGKGKQAVNVVILEGESSTADSANKTDTEEGS